MANQSPYTELCTTLDDARAVHDFLREHHARPATALRALKVATRSISNGVFKRVSAICTARKKRFSTCCLKSTTKRRKIMAETTQAHIEKFANIRATLEMTQLEFATSLGLTGKMRHKRISDMENGRLPIPSYLMRNAELLLENAMLRVLVGEG